MEKFKPLLQVSLVVLILGTLLVGCAAPLQLTVPSYLEEVKPDLQQCLSNTPNVTWDGNITMFNGTGGYASVQGLGIDKGFEVHDVGIGANNTKGQALTILLKEACFNAFSAQTLYDECHYNGDCMSVGAMTSYIDNMSTTMLTYDQQEAIVGHLTQTRLHYDDPVWNLDCSTLKVFKEWEEKGISTGSIKELTEFFQPNGCP